MARKLYYKVAESVIMYTAPIWASGLEHKKNVGILRGIQRTALLRVPQSYRTVPAEALCVMTGHIPIDLLIREREFIFSTRRNNPIQGREKDTGPLKNSAGEKTLEAWQKR